MDNFKVKLTEGFLIALLPILGYILAYSFESGYLSFYGIGEEFISVRLETVIISIFTILSILLLTSIFVELCYPYIVKYQSNNPIHSRLLLSLIALSAGLLFYAINSTIWAILLVILILLLIVALFTVPIFQYRNEDISYIEKLRKDENKSKPKHKTRSFINEILLGTNIRPIAVIISTTVLFIFVSSFMGMFSASMKATYLVYMNNSDSFIVIRSNNEGKIAVGVDLNKKSIKNTYLIINSSKDLELTQIYTGKLSNKSVRHSTN